MNIENISRITISLAVTFNSDNEMGNAENAGHLELPFCFSKYILSNIIPNSYA